MAKHSFVFCKMCETMFLKSEVKDNRCPGCQNALGFMEHYQEEYELDPFEPQSWPFGEHRIRLHKTIHSKSTNGQFEYTMKNRLRNLVIFLVMSIFSFFGMGISIKFITADSNIMYAVIVILFLSGFYCFVIFLEMLKPGLSREFISVDGKNVYLQKEVLGVFKKEIVVPRESCKIVQQGLLNNAFLFGFVDTVEIKIEIELESDEEKCNNTLRWFSTFIKYAYNEDLLPEPETKYGKVLAPVDKVDTLNVDEGEQQSVL